MKIEQQQQHLENENENESSSLLCRRIFLLSICLVLFLAMTVVLSPSCATASSFENKRKRIEEEFSSTTTTFTESPEKSSSSSVSENKELQQQPKTSTKQEEVVVKPLEAAFRFDLPFKNNLINEKQNNKQKQKQKQRALRFYSLGDSFTEGLSPIELRLNPEDKKRNKYPEDQEGFCGIVNSIRMTKKLQKFLQKIVSSSSSKTEDNENEKNFFENEGINFVGPHNDAFMGKYSQKSCPPNFHHNAAFGITAVKFLKDSKKYKSRHHVKSFGFPDETKIMIQQEQEQEQQKQEQKQKQKRKPLFGGKQLYDSFYHFHPDFIFVYIGTNDIGRAPNPKLIQAVNITERIGAIVGHSRRYAEDYFGFGATTTTVSKEKENSSEKTTLVCPVRIIVGTIPPRNDNPKLMGKVNAANERLKGLMLTKTHNKQQDKIQPENVHEEQLLWKCVSLAVVGDNNKFDAETMLYDGLHPNKKGAEILAEDWVNSLI